MELRKICNHPFLISGVEEKEIESLEQEFIANEVSFVHIYIYFHINFSNLCVCFYLLKN